MTQRGWARCTDNVADVLRRGAWYRILEETGDGHVVLEVRAKPVRVSRVDVTVRTDPPDSWSVVTRTGLLRPTLGGGKTEVTTTYAVCPHCQERQEFVGEPARLTCTRCGRESPVDWSARC
ncbi:MAG TPA: hypothetical protein VFK78_09930 [Gemmatimonadales bacterium]|nr:hypothetical protein [Gemmatimonadales bacterium]